MNKTLVQWSTRKNAAGWYEDQRGCHIWLGSRNRDGYGNAWFEGRVHHAHRIRYEREIGPIPEGMELDHYVCSRGHEGCCNPQHCRPVTHRENVLRSDSAAAVNVTKTHCPKGHPLSGRNLLCRPNKRICRTCHNAIVKRWRQAKRHSEVFA